MEYNKKDSYPEVLDKTVGFYNPKNVDNLANELQLGTDNTPSHFMELKGQVPEGEMAPELRVVQANKWSMKSVADGIAYFKAGKFTEAFQCLNKALSIDPNNVEGLTARGALFANNGNFAKAIGDFECALKLNPAHGNARKYLGETLVARGRSFEEEMKYNEAIGSYEACLRIVPYHEEATNSIKYLKEKLESEETDLTSSLPPLNISSKVNDVKATLKQLLAEEKEKEGKKKKEKKKRKRHSSSSSSTSSSDDISSDSSLSSSSSDTSQDSSKKKKKKKKTKERSLSPLSKRMAGSVQGNGLANRTYNPSSATSNLMGIFDSVTQPPPVKSTESEYDLRVTQFLEQTKGDNDYEEKVRKFLEETAKWKKEQRLKDKKKRKKEKKSKDKLKKKKKEEKRRRKLEEKKLKEQANEFRAKTGLAALGVADLQTFQSKLSEFYSRMNKAPSPTPLKKKDTAESSSKVSKKTRRSTSSSSGSEGGAKSPPRKRAVGPSKARVESPPARTARSRSSSPDRKKLDIFADSPPPQSKNEHGSTSKFKMQINSNKVKKESKDWSQDEEEAAPPPAPGVERHKVVNVGVDKLSGFRINLDAQVKKKSGRDSAGRSEDSEDSREGAGKKRKARKRRESHSSSRSERSHKRRSSSRSSSSSSEGGPGNKRYRRKQRYSSDSRSRSRSYSHSRSRSYSPYARRGGGHRGMRGTYYKPRPYYQHPRGGGGMYPPRGRGRGRGYDYRGGRGGYVQRGRGGYPPGGNYNNGGHSRPRYFHYKGGGGGRDQRDSYYGGGGGRYEKRPRSPPDEHEGSASPMRKVHAEKARIDRMIDKHPSGPLSEGEDREDEDGELR